MSLPKRSHAEGKQLLDSCWKLCSQTTAQAMPIAGPTSALPPDWVSQEPGCSMGSKRWLPKDVETFNSVLVLSLTSLMKGRAKQKTQGTRCLAFVKEG